MEITPQIEYHKLNVDGVIFNIKLDYKKKQVSFLDELGNKNKFQFTDRGREYLGGWIKIFRALEKATIWADEKLKEEEERVVGEDEDRNHRYNENWKVEVDAQNYLRKEQREGLTQLEAEL